MKFSRITTSLYIALLLLSLSASVFGESQLKPEAQQLLEQFKNSKLFWQQLEIAKKIAALHDASVLSQLEGWLSHEDRHQRGNAAFIFASLGDDRGYITIAAILEDRSDRPEGQGIATVSSDGRYHVARQIEADRYYAVCLFGDLKDSKALPILIPLLNDKEVNYRVLGSLGEIGDKRAIPAILKALDDNDPSVRVLAIYALEKLDAKEALPRLQQLVTDNEKSHFDRMVSVAEAAQKAISKLKIQP